MRVNQTPQPEPLPELPSCVPDRDGEITADELPIAFGATVDLLRLARRRDPDRRARGDRPHLGPLGGAAR